MSCLVASYVMETKMISKFRFPNDTTVFAGSEEELAASKLKVWSYSWAGVRPQQIQVDCS